MECAYSVISRTRTRRLFLIFSSIILACLLRYKPEEKIGWCVREKWGKTIGKHGHIWEILPLWDAKRQDGSRGMHKFKVGFLSPEDSTRTFNNDEN